ncbi:hypothetical protein [Aliiroseovarius marinus]|uniref:hypothetical protein n=1 Tax=Aliiroseovarius marinus TaxID=2500159 RepID=UPI003D7ED598
MIRWATLFLLVALSPAAAQTVEPCDWRASAANVVEPWIDNSQTFANGDVRLAVLDTVEPAAGAYHLLILSPPYSELGDRQCRVVSLDGSLGFAGLTLDAIEADYDPARGLVFALPAALYDPDTGAGNWGQLFVTLNQASGEITTGMGDLAQ